MNEKFKSFVVGLTQFIKKLNLKLILPSKHEDHHNKYAIENKTIIYQKPQNTLH